MVAPKTVFVIGAGASFEFGLPVGNALKNEIAKVLNFYTDGRNTSVGKGHGYLYEALQVYVQQLGVPDNFKRLIEAARHISLAMPLAFSIDNFIHAHNGNKEIEVCGKLAIAQRILLAESGSKIRILESENSKVKLDWVEDTWIVSLIKLVFEDCNIDQLSERLSAVKFIVFNYDRCIEHFLFHAVQIYFGVDDKRAAELINAVEIYHPYGVVGKLPWQSNPTEQRTVEFGGSPNQYEILKIAGEIKTFTEGTDDSSSDIIAIRRTMEESERIVFLGFAYHRLNVKLLLGDGNLSQRGRRAYGTAFGMSDNDSEQIVGSLSPRLWSHSMRVSNKMKCADLFHEYNRALTFS